MTFGGADLAPTCGCSLRRRCLGNYPFDKNPKELEKHDVFGQNLRMPSRTLRVAAYLVFLSLFVTGCETYRSWRYPCVSRDPGLRGEVMRGANGQFLYFNGQCWTARPMPPTDTPF